MRKKNELLPKVFKKIESQGRISVKNVSISKGSKGNMQIFNIVMQVLYANGWRGRGKTAKHTYGPAKGSKYWDILKNLFVDTFLINSYPYFLKQIF